MALYMVRIVDINGVCVDDAWTSYFNDADYNGDASAVADADYDDAATWAARGGYGASLLKVS